MYAEFYLKQNEKKQWLVQGIIEDTNGHAVKFDCSEKGVTVTPEKLVPVLFDQETLYFLCVLPEIHDWIRESEEDGEIDRLAAADIILHNTQHRCRVWSEFHD